MNRLLRVVLVWVMAFAVPAQGVAAVVMAACGPDHARALQAPAERATDATKTAHDTSRVAGAQVDAVNPFAEPVAYLCAECSSCCSAVPILSPTSVAFLSETGAAAIPWTVVGFRDFINAFPERPPRSLLV